MFLLFLGITLLNFAIGYALAIAFGLAKSPLAGAAAPAVKPHEEEAVEHAPPAATSHAHH